VLELNGSAKKRRSCFEIGIWTFGFWNLSGAKRWV
jgi:hypothetical protein